VQVRWSTIVHIGAALVTERRLSGRAIARLAEMPEDASGGLVLQAGLDGGLTKAAEP